MDLSSEEEMYKLLKKIDCTYISVGHRPTLLNYHSRRLVLRGPGLDPVERMIETGVEKFSTELVDLASF